MMLMNCDDALLGATKHLYNWLCLSVGWSVGRVTRSFDDPHVAPYWPTWPCYLITFRLFVSIRVLSNSV